MNFFFKKKKVKTQSKTQNTTNKKQENISSLLEQFSKSNDYSQIFHKNNVTNIQFSIQFFKTMADEKVLQEDIIPYLLQGKFNTLADLKNIVPSVECVITDNLTEIENNIFHGYALVKIESEEKQVALFTASANEGRDISISEVEYNVEGPKEAFVESLTQNINLIRSRLPIKELVYETFTVGSLSKSKVAVLYIEGLTNQVIVDTVRERLKNIDFDNILDSSFIEEMISDNHNSPFPQLINTERPAKVTSSLTDGKVAILVNGSPFALIGPTTIINFFSSLEDYYSSWYVGSFVRLLRIIGVIFSILATPLYVAILTYHPEIIPKDLMATLISSRENVPFPPIVEAIFLEITIELLREAGARLPTKVAQTIGIVGGIVLGTATVEASLTSNVLLIFVAISALSSFTTPIYKISNAVRLIRFPFLLFAQLWGLLGINLCAWFVISHLLQQNSLGRPYMEPIFPPRFQDVKDSLIRAPFIKHYLRPGYLLTQKPTRFNPKGKKQSKDIDE